MTAPRSPVGDITGRIGSTDEYVKDWIDRLNIELQRDWSGREAVAPEDAARARRWMR